MFELTPIILLPNLSFLSYFHVNWDVKRPHVTSWNLKKLSWEIHEYSIERGGRGRGRLDHLFIWKSAAVDDKHIQGNQRWQIPRHMPVLGNVHPIKIENFDNFSWRHFSARSSFYIINWYGYPRGFHEKYLKEIVSPVFEIRHWIVTC